MKPSLCLLTALAALALQLAPAPGCPAQEARLPVLSLRYEGGVSNEEAEDEVLETASSRHKVTLRLQEEWSDAVTTNLYGVVSRKDYLDDPGSYLYFYLNPDFAWKLNESVTWRTSLRSKWVWYDDLVGGQSGDLFSLTARTEMAVKLAGGTRLTPSLQSVFDLYANEQKGAQRHIAGFSLESRLGDAWRVNGRLRGILRLPLGQPSLIDDRLNYEFAVSATWDPNR